MGELAFERSITMYQEDGDSTQLVNEYSNFLEKYFRMIRYNSIDYSNYDIRLFLCCYISEEGIVKDLRRAKFHSVEAMSTAQRVLRSIRHKLRTHSDEELRHELLIPFLQCAKTYQNRGIGFDKYLYKAYRYELKRHLDQIRWDALDHSNLMYQDVSVEEEWEEDHQEKFVIQRDEKYDLSDPRWIHGDASSHPFSSLQSHERYILVKYYYENHTDKEIARMLPYNPKSIHRIRMRLIRKFKESHSKGEIKWLRF